MWHLRCGLVENMAGLGEWLGSVSEVFSNFNSMRYGEFHIVAPEKSTAVYGKEKLFSVASQVLSAT